jgi:hypothetical protein
LLAKILAPAWEITLLRCGSGSGPIVTAPDAEAGNATQSAVAMARTGAMRCGLSIQFLPADEGIRGTAMRQTGRFMVP